MRGVLCRDFLGGYVHLSWDRVQFVQENYSQSENANVIRGLHFQIPPFAQAKLVRVTSGAILDVAVDIRWGSPDYGHFTATVLTALSEDQLYIPEGFAHGFRTIEPNTGVQYRVNRYYSPEHERGLLWNAISVASSYWRQTVEVQPKNHWKEGVVPRKMTRSRFGDGP